MVERTRVGRTKSYERGDVLQKVVELFWQQGYRATSMSQVMAVTGLNKKSIYAEFGAKEALFHAALRFYGQQRSALAEDWLSRKPPGLDNIRGFFYALCDEVHGRGCLFTLSLNEQKTISQRGVKFVHRVLDGLQSGFQANLAAEYASSSRSDRQRVARYLVTFMQGLMTSARGSARKRELRDLVEVALAACADQLAT